MSSFKTKKISKKTYLNNKYLAHQVVENDDFENKNERNSENFSRKNIQKKSIFRWVIGWMLIFASIIFLGILGARFVSGWGVGGNEESKIFNPIISLINSSGSENIATPKKWVKNILVAGIGGRGHPGGELTDSLMLASLDYDTKNITLLSIPRDLYVAYSSNTAGKINALYPIWQGAGEGVNLLAKKVSEITGQPIHHYMIIDFSGFKSIVNALGGVEVDVPNAIYDREYPNENWGYEVFSLKKWLQNLDGATALKFARSRHSTSDFDRSSRQQLLIRAIKDKALSLGVITNPSKISDLIGSVRENLSTDLTVGDLVDLGVNFKDIDNKNIVMYSINNECSGACIAGAYLYQPSMKLFGTWTVIPEGASRSRLSKYDAIRRYVNTIFTFPQLKNEPENISIITRNNNLSAARNLRTGLEKLGFNINHSTVITQTGSNLENSRIVVNTGSGGIDKDNIVVQALKSIESNIPVIFAEKNEFITNSGARIEIILGSDSKKFFNFSEPVEYMVPANEILSTKTKKTTESTKITASSESKSTNTESEKNPKNTESISAKDETQTKKIDKNTEIISEKSEKSEKTTTQTNKKTTEISNPEYQFQPGEWENF